MMMIHILNIILLFHNVNFLQPLSFFTVYEYDEQTSLYGTQPCSSSITMRVLYDTSLPVNYTLSCTFTVVVSSQ